MSATDAPPPDPASPDPAALPGLAPSERGLVCREAEACPDPLADHLSDPDGMAARVAALEADLEARGLVLPGAVDAFAAAYEREPPGTLGARVVARAWADPAFRGRLRADGAAAARELGVGGRQGEHVVAVECAEGLHHLVVCTLCSCYPWSLLGLPPLWYKSAAYRAKAVRDPRGALADHGVALPPGTALRVWDSTAEVRYLVVPRRPAGTQGWDEARLAALVTRDSMIGAGLARGGGCDVNGSRT